MNYQVGNYISTEYGELPIKHVVFDSYQVIGKDGRILWANKVEPVLLTNEWLLKFGVNRVINSYFFGVDVDFYINTSIGYFNLKIGGIFLKQIKYVHQLQILYFALTGTELKPINV